MSVKVTDASKHTVVDVLMGKSSMWNVAMNDGISFALIADIWNAVKIGNTLAKFA